MPVAVAAVAATSARLPVPSRNLLRFMRRQSDVAFFSSNEPTTSRCRTAVVQRHPRYYPEASPLRRSLARKQSTCCARQATHAPAVDPTSDHTVLRSSFINIEPLLRRLPKSQPTSNTNCFSTTGATRKLLDPGSERKAAAASWQERLWGRGRKGANSLRPNDLPEHEDGDPGSSMFNSRRTLAAKAALEPRLRCTEVDEYGNVILVDGEFKKTELIAKVGRQLTIPCTSLPGSLLISTLTDSTAYYLVIYARSTRPTYPTSSSASQLFS